MEITAIFPAQQMGSRLGSLEAAVAMVFGAICVAEKQLEKR